MNRRRLVGGAAAAMLAPLGGLGGCSLGDESEPLAGGWVGTSVERGHRLRERPAAAASGGAAATRKTTVLIVGGGVAGLACARALQRRGIEEFALLELEDEAGGNSRGHRMADIACPLGAHYIPLPDQRAGDLIELLAEFDLCRQQSGRWVYDERHLCHSPQERLFIADPATPSGGHWVDGLLPPPGLLPSTEQAGASGDYRRFAAIVDRHLRRRRFSIPTLTVEFDAELHSLDAISFESWLDREGLRSPALRWFLDHCCRDDHGAGIARVSAWAGLHYFASRHGFGFADDASESNNDAGVLTWPEGNAWLTTRITRRFGDRVAIGRSVLRISEGRHSVDVDAWDHAGQRLERWTARQVVVAAPLFIAARLLDAPPPALQAALAQLETAPWLVANLHLAEALRDRPGAAPSWDNVIYRGASLGYVDAMHQSTRPHPGPTVLSAYWALGGNNASEGSAWRRRLLDDPWPVWATRVLDELALAHPDLRGKLRRIDLMRYGHAMCIPTPGTRSHPSLAALRRTSGRVSFAHADLSGYSIFEEAFFHGHRVGSTLRT